jgi:hypothetical protein
MNNAEYAERAIWHTRLIMLIVSDMAFGFLPVIYVCYYACSKWDSSVVVMNLQEEDAWFKINVFKQNGDPIWDYANSLNAHATEIITLDDKIPRMRGSGMVVVSPRDDKYMDFEFPSVLSIAPERENAPAQFIPFIRVWRK